MPVTAAPGGSLEPPAPSPKTTSNAKRRPISLSESARLHDLSYDLRAIHAAMLPANVTEAIGAFNALTAPTPEQARAVLAEILEGCESLLDALLACRLVEGSLELAGHYAPTEDERVRLSRDVEGLISMLAGRLSLGALNTVLQADALGQKRGQVRAYRMEMLKREAGKQKAPEEPEAHEGVRAGGWRWLPKRNGALALGAAAMAVALPIAGAIAAPAGSDGVPLWSAIAVLMAISGTATVLFSPFRRATTRRSAPQAEKDSTPPQAPKIERYCTSPPLQHLDPVQKISEEQLTNIDDIGIASWIENSGREIADLLISARHQSLEANFTNDY